MSAQGNSWNNSKTMLINSEIYEISLYVMLLLWSHFQTNMPIMIMECNGMILVRMGSIAGLATHLNLLIIFNRSRQRIID
jgi:hypothetical protein